MKFLVTGDWHVGNLSFGVIQDGGKNSRLLDVANTVEKISTFAREQSVDMLIHCGDVFQTNRPTTEDQLIFYRFLHQTHNIDGIDVRVIIGNHDYNSQLGKGHALKLFMQMFEGSGVKIYDKTQWEECEGYHICFYPYRGEEPDWSGRDRDKSILVCHSHLEGAVVGAEPFEIRDDKATKFKDLPVRAVFAGHFHKPQLLSKNPLVFYPGSIQPIDFNERNDIKGVVLVDTDDWRPRPAGFRTRRLVQIDLSLPCNDLSDRLSRDVSESIVKVNIESVEADAHLFDEVEIRSILEHNGAHSIAAINLNVQRTQVKRDPDIKIDSDVRSNFTRYLKQRDLGDLADEVRQAGYAIIEESVQ